MTTTQLLGLALAYRLIPAVLPFLRGILAGARLYRRGYTPTEAGKAMSAAAEQGADLCARYLSIYQSWWTKDPALLFIDREGFRVTPWLWPLWIGVRLDATDRMLARIEANRYRPRKRAF